MLNNVCPNCGKKIFLATRREFKCAYCSASLRNKNFIFATVIAMLSWGLLELSIILIRDDSFAFILSLILGLIASVFIFKLLTRIELERES